MTKRRKLNTITYTIYLVRVAYALMGMLQSEPLKARMVGPDALIASYTTGAPRIYIWKLFSNQLEYGFGQAGVLCDGQLKPDSTSHAPQHSGHYEGTAHLEFLAARKRVFSTTEGLTIWIGIGPVVNVLVNVRKRLIQHLHLHQTFSVAETR